jgi:hypothetical protein
MLINVEASGTSVEWEFTDSGPFSAWMNGRPWRCGGDVRLLRLPDLATLPAYCHSIERLAYSVELGDLGLKLFIPDPGDEPAESLTGCLTQALCGEPRVFDRFELRKRMLEELNRSPLLIIIVLNPSCGLQIIAAAKILGEELQKEKSPPLYPLTILFVESADAICGDTDFFDFTVGLPRRRLFENGDSENELWQAYLHLRTAWDSAGNPATTTKILDGISCCTGNDDAFESGLNRYATDRLRAIPMKT